MRDVVLPHGLRAQANEPFLDLRAQFEFALRDALLREDATPALLTSLPVNQASNSGSMLVWFAET
jgi:hypothetical protein